MKNDVRAAFRATAPTCPMRGMILDLEDAADFAGLGVTMKNWKVVIYESEFYSERFTDADRMAFYQWMQTKFMPYLNTFGYVTLDLRKEPRRV